MMMRDGLMKLRCSEMSINRNEYKYICPNQEDKLGRADKLQVQIERAGVRSKGRNAGKIRDAAKTRISGSREAERNTGREVSVGGYFTLCR